MMTLNTKPFFQKLLRPVADRLAGAGFTANQVTSATIVLSLIAGAVIVSRPAAGWPLALVPGVLALRLAFNHIDGLLACEHGMKTNLGAMLNELADVISDLALYLPLAAVPGVPGTLLVPAAVLGVIAEMAGVAAVRIGADRRDDGPLGKKSRGLVFAAVAGALGLGVAPGRWLGGVLAVTLALLVLTVVNRMGRALRQASERCPAA